MFYVEFRKGLAVVGRQTSPENTIPQVVVTARARGLAVGADDIRITDVDGNEVGVFPMLGGDDL